MRLVATITALIVVNIAQAQMSESNARQSTPQASARLTAQGYSGFGLIPNAATLPLGGVSVAYGNSAPGSLLRDGHTVTAGFGLLQGLEFSGTLTTNSWHCDFYYDRCRAQEVRDLSTAIKWSPEIEALNRHGVQVALGAKDPGGAAVQFKSYYAVAEWRQPWFTLIGGHSASAGPSSVLKGAFGAAFVNLPRDVRLGVQKLDQTQLATLDWRLPLPERAPALHVTIHRALNESPRVVPQGFELSWSSNLQTQARPSPSSSSAPPDLTQLQEGMKALPRHLQRLGFHAWSLHEGLESGALLLEVENTAFHESAADAAAAAALALALAVRPEDRPITVRVTHRGLHAISLRSSSRCLLRWISDPDSCIEGVELSQRKALGTMPGESAQLLARDSRDWWQRLRPELVLAPNLQSTLGTEVGSFDYDLAVNATVLLPLWKGASLDFNRVIPTGYRSDDFRFPYGVFQAQTAQPTWNRKLIHQLLRDDDWRTTLRLSAGLIENKWEGGQVEWQAFSPSGAHRLAGIWGKWQHSKFVRSNRREYVQTSYRYAWDERHSQTTQIQVGEFWSGDRGVALTHRFWFGERNVALHYRQTRFNQQDPMAYFAGLSITLPLTPRVSRGTSFAGFRGTNAFSYGFETRMRNEANLVGGGFGIFPAVGESIGQQFNRDRMGQDFWDTQLWRVRDMAKDAAEMMRH